MYTKAPPDQSANVHSRRSHHRRKSHRMYFTNTNRKHLIQTMFRWQTRIHILFADYYRIVVYVTNQIKSNQSTCFEHFTFRFFCNSEWFIFPADTHSKNKIAIIATRAHIYQRGGQRSRENASALANRMKVGVHDVDNNPSTHPSIHFIMHILTHPLNTTINIHLYDLNAYSHAQYNLADKLEFRRYKFLCSIL